MPIYFLWVTLCMLPSVRLTFSNLTLASRALCPSEFDVIDPKICPESTSPRHTSQNKRIKTSKQRKEKEKGGGQKGERKSSVMR